MNTFNAQVGDNWLEPMLMGEFLLFCCTYYFGNISYKICPFNNTICQQQNEQDVALTARKKDASRKNRWVSLDPVVAIICFYVIYYVSMYVLK